MSTDNNIEIVFIIGSGRCGSSLVHEMISKHRDVGFISNADDNFPVFNSKGSLNNTLFRSPLGNLTRKGRPRFAPSEAYNLIGNKVSPIYVNGCRNLCAADVTPKLRQSFRRFFYDRYRAQRKKVFIHKYTGWSRVEFFKEIFPEAKFIHIVRDGRAVANSFLQMDWWTGYRGPEQWNLGSLNERQRSRWESSNHSFLVLAGIAWEILVTSIEQDTSRVGEESVRTVRYEDFLQDPAGVLRNLCQYSGLEFNRDFETRISKYRINSDRKQAFLEDLSPAQVLELTSCIADSLDRYGYSDTR